MIHVSEPFENKPLVMKTELQKAVYDTLEYLEIPFIRVDNDEAITMQDCTEISKKLNVRIVKTLFLCNRQKTMFYLFVTTEEKSFVTKDFSKALGISRVSFASSDMLLEMLGTKSGAATVLSSVADTEQNVNIIFDSNALNEEWYGCTDGTTTGYMKIRTEDLINKYLPFTNHRPIVIKV